eukprot:3375727-Lingulodinium_polyedra.AAC.1
MPGHGGAPGMQQGHNQVEGLLGKGVVTGQQQLQGLWQSLGGTSKGSHVCLEANVLQGWQIQEPACCRCQGLQETTLCLVKVVLLHLLNRAGRGGIVAVGHVEGADRRYRGALPGPGAPPSLGCKQPQKGCFCSAASWP